MTRPAEPLLLYCFAPAGTGAHVFRRWSRLLPLGTIVRPIERPGHGKRMGEPALREYAALVDTLAAEVAGDMHSRRWNAGPVRYAVFGHGAGASFSFGVALRLQTLLDLPPAHCFVSDGLPPHHAHPACSTLSDKQLLRAMFAAGDGHGGIFDRADSVSLLLPLYRADIAALEGAVMDAGMALDCPITSFARPQSGPAPEQAWDWQPCTRGRLTRVMLGAADARAREPLNQVLGHLSDLSAVAPRECSAA